MDEKYVRLRHARVPFIETSRETAFEEQPLGPPLEREIIVIRIDKSHLKLYSFLPGFVLLLILVSLLSSTFS